MIKSSNNEAYTVFGSDSKPRSSRDAGAITIFGRPEMQIEAFGEERPFYRRPAGGNRRTSSFQILLVFACVLLAATASYLFGVSRQTTTPSIDKGHLEPERAVFTQPEPELVSLPGGVFLMGDTIDKMTDAKPVHVRLTSFKMSEHEVTLGLWEDVRLWGKSHGYSDLPYGSGRQENHPVCGVSWTDAIKWCNALSEIQGLTPCYYKDKARLEVARHGLVDISNDQVNWQADGYRLPTEAEWEYAARGGLEGQRFPSGNHISHDQANYHSKGEDEYDHSTQTGPPPKLSGSPPFSMPAGSFPANNFGLYDMAGNVAEWCWDFYWPRTSELPPILNDPLGPESGSACVVRGGSWRHSAADARCASRFSMPGNLAALHVGFRIVRSH